MNKSAISNTPRLTLLAFLYPNAKDFSPFVRVEELVLIKDKKLQIVLARKIIAPFLSMIQMSLELKIPNLYALSKGTGIKLIMVFFPPMANTLSLFAIKMEVCSLGNAKQVKEWRKTKIAKK